MAGLIPQSFINDLIDRVDIVDVIDTRLQLKKAGKNYQALCPFHSEKSPSFSVSPDKQFYHCFGCGMSGTALTFLMEFERLEFVEAVETLAASVGLEVPREQSRQRVSAGLDPLYQLLGKAATFYQQQLRTSPTAVDYLKARGLTGIIAKDFGIGYAPPGWDSVLKALGQGAQQGPQAGSSAGKATLLSAGLVVENDKGRTYDRFRERIMFPIRDTRGRVIGFGGRVLKAEDNPKYLNSPETPVFQKGRELYGLYEARRALRQLDRLLVVEGYMDVVALAQHGIPNAVASLGTATSTTQFQKLFRYTNEVVCCFDGDTAGRQAAWRALENALSAMEDGRQLKFMFLPDGEDPDSLVRSQGKAHLDTLVGNAMSAVEYLFQQLAKGLDLESLDGRARLASLAKPHIDKVPAGVLQQLMQQRLSQLTGIAVSGGPQAASAANLAPAASGQQARPPQRSNNKLQAFLLKVLLKHPTNVQELEAPLRQALSELPVEDLLGQIVIYIADHPGADQAAILASRLGEPEYEMLLQYARRPLEVDAAAASKDFADGVRRYLRGHQQQQIRVAKARLDAEPTAENLRHHQQLLAASKSGLK